MDTPSEVFLLLTADAGGPAKWGTQRGWALGAAAIADLVVAQRVALGDEKDPRVRVVDPTPTSVAVLDTVLARVAEKEGKRLSALVQDRRLNPEDEVVAALEAAGVVEVVPRRLLGLVPAKYPALDPGPERHVRDRLQTVIRGGQPSTTDATTLAILHALGAARKVLAAESAGMSAKDLERRIKQATREVAVGDAIKRALDALNAALLTAVIVPAAVGSTGG